MDEGPSHLDWSSWVAEEGEVFCKGTVLLGPDRKRWKRSGKRRFFDVRFVLFLFLLTEIVQLCGTQRTQRCHRKHWPAMVHILLQIQLFLADEVHHD